MWPKIHLKFKDNHYTLQYSPKDFLFGFQTLSQEYTLKMFYFWPFTLKVCSDIFYEDEAQIQKRHDMLIKLLKDKNKA